ncbi:4398_t:CDS:1, partial [Dentiscutata erythropus]
KYYRARSTYLSKEAIKEIKNSAGKGPNIIYTMAKKYYISPSRVKEYIENRERKQQVDFILSSILSQNSRFIGDSPSHNFWNKEIERIYNLYSELPY